MTRLRVDEQLSPRRSRNNSVRRGMVRVYFRRDGRVEIAARILCQHDAIDWLMSHGYRKLAASVPQRCDRGRRYCMTRNLPFYDWQGFRLTPRTIDGKRYYSVEK